MKLVDHLLGRVPEALRGAAAYHVPEPPVLHAKLDANELPYGLPDDLRARLAAVLADVSLERYPDPTARELRAAVARSLGVAGEQITFGNGSDELIAILASAFATGPVLYPTPSFVYYRMAAVNRGLAAVEVPLRADFTLDEDAVERAIAEHRPAVVFLALPNNPTGTLWRMSFAVELAARHPDVAIVSDEAYAAFSGQTNLAHLAALPNLVVMRTLSKIGFAGLRVGFTIAAPPVAAVLEKVRPPYNLGTLAQRAARFAVEDGAAWAADRAALVVAERTVLTDGLRALGFDVVPSEANFVLVRIGDKAREIWRALGDGGVIVRAFGPGPLAGCLRFTVGTPEENRLALRILAGVR